HRHVPPPLDHCVRRGLMSPEDTSTIRADIRELRDELSKVVNLQRETNRRLGKLESRVFDIEIWRARLQGAAATSRIVWLLAGGAVTGLIIELIRNV
ncbi:MAG: hypothetical protein ACO3WK_10270, partial [Steroidobacteraceae bacterium]